MSVYKVIVAAVLCFFVTSGMSAFSQGKGMAGGKAGKRAAAKKTASSRGYFLIAHRGGVVDDLKAENSLPALEAAIQAGYNMVEVDLRVTKDGVLVINHDPNLQKYYGVNRLVTDMTWQECSVLTSDMGGSKVLTFEEVLQHCAGKIQVMIDNKIRGNDTVLFGKLVSMLNKYHMRGQALMIGTDESTEFFTGKIKLSCTRKQLEENMHQPGYSPVNYYLFASDITKEDVEWAKAHDILAVGAVNEWQYRKSATAYEDATKDIERLKATGVSYFQIDSKYEPLLRPAARSADFDAEGHRGCRGLMPENTIGAMLRAVDLGVTLEMDISFSKEKIALVDHDQYILSSIALQPNGDTISKEEEKQLILYQMPVAEIRKYIFGVKPNVSFPAQKKQASYVPMLAELIDSVEHYARRNKKALPHYNIETKTSPEGDNVLHPGPDEFVQRLMDVILEKKIQERVIIQSFDPRTLVILHAKYPSIPTSLLVSDGGVAKNVGMLGFKPSIYSPNYLLVDEQTVRDCHAAHIRIIPWTVNDPAAISRLKSLGVDGIISDYPDRL